MVNGDNCELFLSLSLAGDADGGRGGVSSGQTVSIIFKRSCIHGPAASTSAVAAVKHLPPVQMLLCNLCIPPSSMAGVPE